MGEIWEWKAALKEVYIILESLFIVQKYYLSSKILFHYVHGPTQQFYSKITFKTEVLELPWWHSS